MVPKIPGMGIALFQVIQDSQNPEPISSMALHTQEMIAP